MAKSSRHNLPSKIKSKPLSARVFRLVARRYQHQPLSMEGSLTYGGRYNPPYQFGALYFGLTPEICWIEIEKKNEGPVKRSRFKIFSIRIALEKVLDLSDPGILEQLQIKADDLVKPFDYELTRNIAIRARAQGYEGILAPSSAGQGKILIIFLDLLMHGSSVEIERKKHPNLK